MSLIRITYPDTKFQGTQKNAQIYCDYCDFQTRQDPHSPGWIHGPWISAFKMR